MSEESGGQSLDAVYSLPRRKFWMRRSDGGGRVRGLGEGMKVASKRI